MITKGQSDLFRNSIIAQDDEIVTLFNSLVIKKSQFISLNLDTTNNPP